MTELLNRSTCPTCGRLCFDQGGIVTVEAARTNADTYPVDDFLSKLEDNPRHIDKAAAVAVRIEDFARYGDLPIPRELNELRNGLWEIKAEKVRLPFFWIHGPFTSTAIRLTHGFIKNTDRTPRREIDKATWIRKEDLRT